MEEDASLRRSNSGNLAGARGAFYFALTLDYGGRGGGALGVVGERYGVTEALLLGIFLAVVVALIIRWARRFVADAVMYNYRMVMGCMALSLLDLSVGWLALYSSWEDKTLDYGPQKPYEIHPSLTRILAIAAHPDDNEFSIAGSVAKWVKEGREVIFCLVTSGSAGTNRHTHTNEGLVLIRERESLEAARILGVKDIVFLRYQDGTVEPTLGLRRDLTGLFATANRISSCAVTQRCALWGTALLTTRTIAPWQAGAGHRLSIVGNTLHFPRTIGRRAGAAQSQRGVH